MLNAKVNLLIQVFSISHGDYQLHSDLLAWQASHLFASIEIVCAAQTNSNGIMYTVRLNLVLMFYPCRLEFVFPLAASNSDYYKYYALLANKSKSI